MAPLHPRDMSSDPVRRQAHAWVRRLTSGEATVSDAEALKRWCEADEEHAAAFAEAQRLWQDFDAAGRQLLRRSPASAAVSKPERHWSRRAFLGGAMTATAALAVAVVVSPPLEWWPAASEWDADYRTATGEQKQVRLADGVWLALNTQTSIALQQAGGDMQGIRLISGETAVDTGTGLARPFSVIAGEGRTWTKGGARFEIRHDGDRVCVTCLAGEIEVEQGAQRQTLRERQRLFYGADGLQQKPVTIDPVSASAWREGVVVFRRTPLSEAVAEINRYRPGRVLLLDKKLGANVVSGRFGIRDMDHVIAQIQEAFGARVTTLPGNVVLLS